MVPKLNRFLTPSEAGKMTDEESQQFDTWQANINEKLSQTYVPGHPDPVRVSIPGLKPRVAQKLKEGLEAAGWVPVIRENDVTISEKPRTGTTFVDKRNQSR